VGSLGGRASSGGHHAPGAKEEVGREAEREERERKRIRLRKGYQT
jgi:hypothetical protein